MAFTPGNPNFELIFGPLSADSNLQHLVFFDETTHKQTGCSFTVCPIRGTSNYDYAFNLKKGFKYKVIHKVVKSKKGVHCTWTVIQLPYPKKGSVPVKHKHCRGGGSGSFYCPGPNYACHATCNFIGHIPDCANPKCVQ